jgi:hypothetical protein
MKSLKRMALLAVAFMFILLAAACSGRSQSPADVSNPEYQSGTSDGKSEAGFGTTPEQAPSTDTSDLSIEEASGHKVIQTVNISLETRNFDNDRQHIIDKVKEVGGYVSSSNLNGRVPTTYSDTGRLLSMAIRVPAEKLDAFVNDAKGVATLISMNEGSSDITASYIDTESRVRVLNIQLEKLETLRAQCEPGTDMITIENEIARVRVELEQLTTQIKQWDDLVDFATVNISIQELPPASAAADEDSAWTRMQEGFTRTFTGVGVFFEEFFIFLISALPALIVIAVVTVGIVFIVKGAKKRKRAKQARLAEQQPKPDEANK